MGNHQTKKAHTNVWASLFAGSPKLPKLGTGNYRFGCQAYVLITRAMKIYSRSWGLL